MTSTVILNDFRAPDLWRNKYRRSTFEIWDANLHHGDVRPFACPELVCNESYKTFIHSEFCGCEGITGFAQRTSVVKGFCRSSYYYIENGTLKYNTNVRICNGLDAYQAGAPVPQSPTSVYGGDCNQCDIMQWAYVITYVVLEGTRYIESAPSYPIGPGTGTNPPNLTVEWPAAPAAFSDYNIVATRLYRVEASFEDGTDSMPSHGGEYTFVAEFSGSGAIQYLDTIPSSRTGGPLTTYEPMIYPAQRASLVAVVKTADGIAVAERNRVFISESGMPMFSFDGVVDVEDDILDMVAIGNTIFVLTNNRPVKIAYQHTDGVMSIDKQIIERSLPLTSLDSVSVYDGKVYFASNYSLYVWDIGSYGNDVAAQITPLLSPEQWRNLDPSTIVGTAYEFGYILSSDTIDYSLMIEFGGDRTDTINGTSIMPISFINPVAMGLDINGHIIYTSVTGGVYRWDWRRLVSLLPFNVQDHVRPHLSDQCDCCPWLIKMYFDNEGKNRFSKMRVEWDERSATHLDVRFYLEAFGNEEEITNTLKVIRSRGFSIPKFNSSQTFCVEVSGCGIMHEIRMATSNQELVSNSNNLIGNPGEE